MAFGPDGFLYISSGDGGGNGYQNGQQDQSFNSQDLTDNLLGKILRIDVDSDAFPEDPTRNYQLPSSNPFVGTEGDDEIWSYGLRNPWRPSFDRVTGDFYIADVGQSAQEEVNFQPAGLGGQNYGWNRFEGYLPYRPVSMPEDITSPIYAYGREYGRSITGGYVYRGPATELQGEYIFGDFGTGKIASFNVSALSEGIAPDEVTERTFQFAPAAGQGTINKISSFGEDATGNLYIIDYDGEIFKVNASSAPPVDNTPPIFIETEISFPENSIGPVGLMFIDPDGDPVEVTAVEWADAGRFRIVDGVLELKDAADFEAGLAPYKLSVTISDGKSDGLTTAAVVVSITNVNEQPVFTQPVAPFVVTKGAASGAVVGQVSAVDPEGDPLTYTITGGNPDTNGDGIGAFQISVPGFVSVGDASDLSSLPPGELALQLEVSDGTLTGSTPLKLQINPSGDSLPKVLNGTSGADLLTAGIDFSPDGASVNGRGGSDSISGLDIANSTLLGSLGDDSINTSGGLGSNILKGGPGQDRLQGGLGDTLYGGADNDLLISGGGSTLYGGAGIDSYALTNLEGAVSVIRGYQAGEKIFLPSTTDFSSISLERIPGSGYATVFVGLNPVLDVYGSGLRNLLSNLSSFDG
jgi:hypothetical protein